MKTVCFVHPALLMFVVAKASKTPTVNGPISNVLQGQSQDVCKCLLVKCYIKSNVYL